MSGTVTGSVITPNDFQNAIIKGDDFTFEFSYLDKESEVLLLRMVSRYLARIDRLFLRDAITTIVKELVNNAVKANAKRLYFINCKLDIHDPQDYSKGMKSFRKDVLFENSETINALSATPLRVIVTFSQHSKMPNIVVSNNIPIVEDELQKIRQRIAKAYEYKDITEAFTDMLDSTEGAGLGIIMAIMVFKNSGFSRDDFVIDVKQQNTSFGLHIRNADRVTNYETRVADEISREIEYLPSFPETIMHISKLCESRSTTIAQITDYIRRDPALTASILKKANSAGYMIQTRVNSIEEAVKLIGMKGIKTLAIASGMDGIVLERYKKFKSIWAESYKKAFYAHRIAIQTRNDRIADLCYLASLITKIGEIVLLSIKRDTTEKLIKLAGMKNIASMDFLEEITIGISRPTLSALITKKWNFDGTLCVAIEYHQRPHLAPKASKELVYIIYLADLFVEFEKNAVRYQSADYDVLHFFNIEKEEEFTKLFSVLKQAYQFQE